MEKSGQQKVNFSGKSKIKGIIFDLDNTLYAYQPAHKAGLIAAHKKYPVKYTNQQFFKKYDVAHFANERDLFGVSSSHNRILYFQRMLEADNCFTPQRALDLASAYWIAFIGTMKIEMDTRRTLLTLVRSYKLGILSDLTADTQFAKMSVHRLWPFFDAIVTSEEIGVEKPQTAGLKSLLKKLKLKASEVVFVGDNPVNDGIVAKRSGIKFIQVLRKDMAGAQNAAKPYAKIKKISELLPILKRL